VAKLKNIIDQVRERPHHRPDYFLGLLVLGLIGVGMIVIYSTGSIVNFNITGGASDRNSFFYKQMISLAVGLVGWVFAARMHYSHWRKLALPMLIVSFILMLLVFVPGLSDNVNGASRWIKLGSFSFQPAEFLKLSLVLYLAAWLEAKRDKLRSITHGLLPFLGVLALTMVLVVVLQRDLGTGMVIVALSMAILLVSDAPLWIFATGLIATAAAAVMAIIMFPYRLARLSTFINHKDDLTGADYHINQALIALGSGGPLGKGLGNSLQSYGYLPEATNDSIYAIIGEQFGLWGTTGVVTIFGLLGWRGFRIAKMAPDRFGRLLAVGITVWLLTQALVNISAMLGIIPLTGIPLPFISYGGTSLAATMVAVGILQNISRYTEREQSYADSRIGRRNRRARHTGFGPVHGTHRTF
jgi:cell division protein FtsW